MTAEAVTLPTVFSTNASIRLGNSMNRTGAAATTQTTGRDTFKPAHPLLYGDIPYQFASYDIPSAQQHGPPSERAPAVKPFLCSENFTMAVIMRIVE